MEALENYVSVITRDEKYTIHFTMRAIEQQLPSLPFCENTPVVPCKQECYQVDQRKQPYNSSRQQSEDPARGQIIPRRDNELH